MFSGSKALAKAVALLSICAAAFTLAGCKADEAKSTGFTDKSVMTKDASIPFQRSWKKPGFDKSKYTKIYIAPVNTQYMLSQTDWDKGINKAEFEKDVAKLGVFTQEAIKKAFREDPNHRMQVLDEPTHDKDALILEAAIIEVVPSKVALNALGYAPFGIGTTVNAVRMIAKDTSTCACEMRVSDAGTNETVAMMADREAQQFAVASVRGFTWYSNAETIITQWAGQLVQLMNRKPGENVKDVDAFTLKPW
jgi:hypothetical protein